MEKIYKNSRIPKLFSIFINVYAITLWPFIFIKDDGDDKVLNHERIHLKQQWELLVIFFYLFYTLFWLINMARFRDSQKAYLEIPFEKEAHANEANWVYTLNRKRVAWVGYIKSR